jgi:hypothetical protein
MKPKMDWSFPTIVLDATTGQWWRIHGAAHRPWFFASSDLSGGRPIA